MLPDAEAVSSPMHLLRLTDGLVMHLAVCAAARFGIADVLAEWPCESDEIAARLALNEQAVFRTLRYLSGHGVFEQTAPRALRTMNCRVACGRVFPGLSARFLRSGEVIDSCIL
jgi:hypothetical protein